MVVDFPIIGLEEYWLNFLMWLPYRSDEELVEGLVNVLATQYRKKSALKDVQKKHRVSEL